MATISEFDYLDAVESYSGWCNTCKAFTADNCEPDLTEAKCPDCGQYTVYGAKTALVMGLFELNDE